MFVIVMMTFLTMNLSYGYTQPPHEVDQEKGSHKLGHRTVSQEKDESSWFSKPIFKPLKIVVTDTLFRYSNALNPELEKKKFCDFKGKWLFEIYKDAFIPDDAIIDWEKHFKNAYYSGTLTVTNFDYGRSTTANEYIGERALIKPHNLLIAWMQNLKNCDLEKGNIFRKGGKTFIVYYGYSDDKKHWLRIEAKRKKGA